MQVIVELIHRVDKEEPIEKLEATLKRDPPLAFKLLRYINSPAFGLRVEISSFRHAIMMLGYQRLKRWLALSARDRQQGREPEPVMFAAVRRGLLMEELVAQRPPTRRCATRCSFAASFLARSHVPAAFATLLDTIPVPERVRQALAEETGPYKPYIELVRAVESESLFRLPRDAADT
jgi:EAL and modified HD-GYP domain-containing signal transduction protein